MLTNLIERIDRLADGAERLLGWLMAEPTPALKQVYVETAPSDQDATEVCELTGHQRAVKKGETRYVLFFDAVENGKLDEDGIVISPELAEDPERLKAELARWAGRR